MGGVGWFAAHGISLLACRRTTGPPGGLSRQGGLASGAAARGLDSSLLFYRYALRSLTWISPGVPETARERHQRGEQPVQFTAEQIERRILAVMANAGAKVLAEGISLRPSNITVFPAGGRPDVCCRPRRASRPAPGRRGRARAGGSGSEPAPLLVQLSRERRIFADWQKQKRRGSI